MSDNNSIPWQVDPPTVRVVPMWRWCGTAWHWAGCVVEKHLGDTGDNPNLHFGPVVEFPVPQHKPEATR